MAHVPVHLERYGFKLWLDTEQIPIEPIPGTVKAIGIMTADPSPPVDNSVWFVRVVEGSKVYVALKANAEAKITELLKVRIK
jgi:hypothetical protein